MTVNDYKKKVAQAHKIQSMKARKARLVELRDELEASRAKSKTTKADKSKTDTGKTTKADKSKTDTGKTDKK